MPARIDRADEVGACVSLSQFEQDVVVDRFHGARDHQASRVAQETEHLDMSKNVFDLDRDVVSQTGELARDRFHQSTRVGRSIQEIGIAK